MESSEEPGSELENATSNVSTYIWNRGEREQRPSFSVAYAELTLHAGIASLALF